MMADSGARGSHEQVRQLAGMRGLMSKPSGEVIETPITANFREGLSVLQYFISTHGARKGLADTALKTADSGYLTRRLVDVAQDVIITEQDCGTIDGITCRRSWKAARSSSRCATASSAASAQEDIYDPMTGELIVAPNEEITEVLGNAVQAAGIEQVKIRSVLTCETRRGVCAAATAATSRAARWSRSARRWVSSPRSRSASPARSSPCVPSTTAVRRAACPSSRSTTPRTRAS